MNKIFKYNRRKFCTSAGVATVSFVFLPNLGKASYSKFLLMTGQNFQKTADDKYIAGNNGSAQFFNPNKRELIVELNLQHDGHSFLRTTSDSVFAISKMQTLSSRIDEVRGMNSRPLVSTFHALAGYEFGGHAALHPNGREFYATEQRRPDKLGKLVARDIGSLSIIRVYETFGVEPHEVKVVDNGRSVIVANGSEGGNMAVIDLATGKLLERYDTPDFAQCLRHFVLSADGHMLIGCEFLGGDKLRYDPPARLVIGRRGEPNLRILEIPSFLEWGEMRPGQYLSVAIDPKREIVAATNPKANFVVFLELKTGRYLGHHSIPSPTGVAFEQGSFWINNKAGSLWRVHKADLSLQSGSPLGMSAYGGVHLYAL